MRIIVALVFIYKKTRATILLENILIDKMLEHIRFMYVGLGVLMFLDG
jgi:hypothetical protein